MAEEQEAEVQTRETPPTTEEAGGETTKASEMEQGSPSKKGVHS